MDRNVSNCKREIARLGLQERRRKLSDEQREMARRSNAARQRESRANLTLERRLAILRNNAEQHRDQDKRLYAYTELCWASRSCDPDDDRTENLTGVLERLERDPATRNFASYLLKEWLPSSHQVSCTGNTLTPEHDSYSTGIYLDILHCLLHFLFVEEQFSLDYDECVAKLNLYSATVLSALKDDVQAPSATVTPEADVTLPRCRASLLIAARHAEAATLGPGSVASVKPHEWQVRCHVQSGVWYSVRRQTRKTQLGSLKSMCSTTCKQACWQCEVCVHQYSCSCPDSIILSTVCVHVHLIRILMRNPHHGSHVNTNSTPTSVIPVGINNAKVFKGKEKMKLSIRSKCATLMSLLKNNTPPTTTGTVPYDDNSNNQWSKERLSKCDALLDQALASLHGHATPSVKQTTTAEATPSLLLHDRSTTVLSNTESSGMQMLYPTQDTGASGVSRVPLHPSYSDPQTLGAEISTVESLLVLHEENGRFRLVGGGEEDLLQEPTAAKAPPSDLIYLDDARRPRVEGAALGDADSTSAELAGEDSLNCEVAGNYR
ncbi:hypothetical protein FHG87_015273 [Trinorchestia longiramus]|nr:hypothetical protein FHG87_015273 [Trinorchestia longiramus]